MGSEMCIRDRLTGEQIWMSTVKHEVVGYTDLSDEDIQLTCKFSHIPQYGVIHSSNIVSSN